MKKLLLATALVTFSSVSMAELHKTCEDYFKQIETVKELPAEVKAQLEQSKKAIEQMPAAAQEQACKQGLDALKMMVPAK